VLKARRHRKLQHLHCCRTHITATRSAASEWPCLCRAPAVRVRVKRQNVCPRRRVAAEQEPKRNLEYIDGSYSKGTRAHAQGTDLEGASRASKGQEALWPPVLKAPRRRKWQHLHRCRTHVTATRSAASEWPRLCRAPAVRVRVRRQNVCPRRVGLHTILPSPIMHGVQYKKGWSVGGAYIAQWSCNSITIG